MLMYNDNVSSESDKTEISDDQWGAFILSIIFMFMGSKRQLWDDFKTELLTQNRFFPTSPIPELIKKISSKCSVKLPKDTILYRARIFDYEESSASNYLKEAMQSPDIKENEFYDLIESMQSEKSANLNTYEILALFTFIQGLIVSDPIQSEKFNNIIRQIDLFDKSNFYGFDREQSDAPPSAKATAGRANPANISYLYASETLYTALVEVRPMIYQSVSIAELEILEDLKIFDFSTELEQNSAEFIDLGVISSAYSEINYGSEYNYLPTQYIAELIKGMGFDGIRFKSSLDKEGYNITIFNADIETKKYNIISSFLYNVDNIRIEANPICPKDAE